MIGPFTNETQSNNYSSFMSTLFSNVVYNQISSLSLYLLTFISYAVFGRFVERWEECPRQRKTATWQGTVLHQGKLYSRVGEKIQNFQIFLEEKDRNIHLNHEFPLKIAKISLQQLNFMGMRIPNSTFCPCMLYSLFAFLYTGSLVCASLKMLAIPTDWITDILL